MSDRGPRKCRSSVHENRVQFSERGLSIDSAEGACYHTEVKKVRNSTLVAWFVILASVGVGLVFGTARLAGGSAASVPVSATTSPAGTEENGEDPFVATALRYARALQDGFCEEVIRTTAWMADRMHRVAIESSGQEAIDGEWDTLCEKAMERSIEGNVIRPEGVEDQYIFAPGVTFEVLGVDDGRDDLNRPVARRVWIRATFPRRQTAPLAQADDSPRMLAVRAVTVGVNLSRDDQLVVKAGVLGNLDIDMSSLSFDWPGPEGG